MKNPTSSLISNIIADEVTTYTDINNPSVVYVEYPNIHGVRVFEPLTSERFKAFLTCRYREESGERIAPSLDTTLEIMKDDAIYQELNPVLVNKRLSGSIHNEKIIYFLADERWRMAMITPNSVKIGNNANHKFLKSPVDQAQVTPKRGGDLLKLLRPYINLSHNDFLLFTIALIQSFSRETSHFAFIFSSEKGSGKSTLTKLIRTLVDPSMTGNTLTPNTEGDLKNALAANYLLTFDNSSPLKSSFSDILCAAITGTTDSKRKLYTDNEQVILTLHNFIIINGINAVPKKADLLERTLLFELQKISSDQRKADTDFWNDFNRDKPAILGAIFEVIAKAMDLFPSLNYKGKLHRMADANSEMLAIAEALGIDHENFQDILFSNVEKSKNIYSTDNDFVADVITFVYKYKKINDTATNVFDAFNANLKKVPRSYPQSSSSFSRRLNEETDALNTAGIDFHKTHAHAANYLHLSLIPANQLTKAQREYRNAFAENSCDTHKEQG